MLLDLDGEAALNKAPDAFRTISEVADDLDLPQHVLRFWESRFPQIKPMKRGGGRRYYRPDDVELLRGIRHLLYGEGYTIRGVQRILREQGARFVQAVWQEGAPQPQRGTVGEELAGEDFADEEAERPHGSLEALPPLFSSDAKKESGKSGKGGAVRREPVLRGGDEPSLARPGATASSGGVSRAHVERLQAMLKELGECKRMLDDALNDV